MDDKTSEGFTPDLEQYNSIAHYTRKTAILAFMEVTCWYLITDKGPVYNHLENGYSTNAIPLAKFDTQRKNWNGQKWLKKYALRFINKEPNNILEFGVFI